MTPNADLGAVIHVTPICDEMHRLNSTTLHREGFCLACAEVYEALHRLLLVMNAPPNDSSGAP